MRPEQQALIDAVAAEAALWREPDYPPREGAAQRTLEAPNRFTGEALAFAVNQQMHLLTRKRLAAWAGERWAAEARTVGVLNAGNIPLVGLQDFLAVILTGHRYRGSVSSKSPHLLPAFAAGVGARVGGLDASFRPAEALFAEAQAIIATGGEETGTWVEAQCEAHGIPEGRLLLRGHRYSVAILDGRERAEEREKLAEDVLLHEGYGCRNVALIWAPAGLKPDKYLEAFALFRGVFPAHTEVAGTLQLQKAFLEALDVPHAYGEGLAFLVSKGPPEAQRPGHARWTEYGEFEAAVRWLLAHAGEIQLVAARPEVGRRLPGDLPVVSLGQAQRPPLNWCPDGKDTLGFLGSL